MLSAGQVCICRGLLGRKCVPSFLVPLSGMATARTQAGRKARGVKCKGDAPRGREVATSKNARSSPTQHARRRQVRCHSAINVPRCSLFPPAGWQKLQSYPPTIDSQLQLVRVSTVGRVVGRRKVPTAARRRVDVACGEASLLAAPNSASRQGMCSVQAGRSFGRV